MPFPLAGNGVRNNHSAQRPQCDRYLKTKTKFLNSNGGWGRTVAPWPVRPRCRILLCPGPLAGP
eukprot:6916103-Prymnesium_polylepis.1